MLADRVGLRIGDAVTDNSADIHVLRSPPPPGTAIAAANLAMSAHSTHAAVRVQSAARGMLSRRACALQLEEQQRCEWIAFYVGNLRYEEARALGWDGDDYGAPGESCVVS